MENTVEKGEIAHFEQFHLFPQCFPKAFFHHCVTMSIWRKQLMAKPSDLANQKLCYLQIYNVLNSKTKNVLENGW